MVTIKQKKRKLKFLFTINAWLICCDELGIDFYELGSTTDGRFSDLLIYGAYVNACLKTRQKQEFDAKQLKRWIGKCTVDDMDKLKDAMLSAKIMGRTVGQIMKEKEPEKK